jgi:hypothetical protein
VEYMRVVVYGNSLSMAGIAASLKAEAGLAIVPIDPHDPTARQMINEIDPAVIAFDLNEPSMGLDIFLLRERPGLLLIGVDLASDKLLVLSSHASQAQCMADLIDIIRRKRN